MSGEIRPKRPNPSYVEPGVGLSPRGYALFLLILGGCVVILGVGLLSVPIAIILAGVGIGALGLLAVEVNRA
jgi:hypothetical protein